MLSVTQAEAKNSQTASPGGQTLIKDSEAMVLHRSKMFNVLKRPEIQTTFLNMFKLRGEQYEYNINNYLGERELVRTAAPRWLMFIHSSYSAS